ncbi:hypothetical protein [Candidatus Nitrospira nitrificans]|nr:hypothetical protein [Candidatus Nitrospira nitrificans]
MHRALNAREARFFEDGTWDETYGNARAAVIESAGQDNGSRMLKVLPDQSVLTVGQGKQTANVRQDSTTIVWPLSISVAQRALFGLAQSLI